jgi:uridine kinase
MTMQAMRAVNVPEYDFTLHQRSNTCRRVEPADVVIIEGIMVLHMQEIRDLLHMKIYVDTDDDVRLARRQFPPLQILDAVCMADKVSVPL